MTRRRSSVRVNLFLIVALTISQVGMVQGGTASASSSARGRIRVVPELLFGQTELGRLETDSKYVAVFANELVLAGEIERPVPKRFKAAPTAMYLFADTLRVRRGARLNLAGRSVHVGQETRWFDLRIPADGSERKREARRYRCYRNKYGVCIDRTAHRFCRSKGYAQSREARPITWEGSRFVWLSRVKCEGKVGREFADYGYGTDLTLVARTIDCPDGRLRIDVSGGRAGADVKRAGRLRLVVEDRAAMECIESRAEGGKGRPGHRRPDHSGHDVAGFLSAVKDTERRLYGEWVLGLVEHAISAMNEAEIAHDMQETKRYAELAERYLDRGRYPVTDEQQATWGRLAEKFRSTRAELIPPLWDERIALDLASGMAPSVHVFHDSGQSGAQLAPTHLLVRRLDDDGRPILGYLLFDPDRPERMELSLITAELAVDPRARTAAAEVLEERGVELDGQFSDWLLTVDAPRIAGLRSISTSGDGAELVFTIELDTGGDGMLALQRLVGAGIPLTFAWESVRYPEITGRFGPLNLSLARQTQTDLAFDGDDLVNSGSVAQRLDYVLTSGQVNELDRGIVVEAWSKTVYSGRAGEIVPHAVTHLLEPHQVPGMFGQLQSDVVETVQLVNMVGSDPELGTLHHVELVLEFDGGNGRQVSDAIKLSSRGTFGAEKRLTFFRGPSTAMLSGTGTAVFDDGSRQDFTIARTTDLVLKITPALIGI